MDWERDLFFFFGRKKLRKRPRRFERALSILPEWIGSLLRLLGGPLYFQTGQIEKAREVLVRFTGAGLGSLDW